jgi:hypothetical protein
MDDHPRLVRYVHGAPGKSRASNGEGDDDFFQRDTYRFISMSEE